MMLEEALTYLYGLPRFAGRDDAAYRPGLERMEALMDRMGRPHEAFDSAHVAGTNGKGSTASFLAAIATAAGRRTGLHTSPHLVRLTERMRIDGRPAPDAWLADAVARYRDAFEAVRPSFFEATVALSFLYFAEESVDLAVVEVGLGGRLDATNILHPEAALITHIGRDHMELLGETLPEIAREKGGIIKPGVPVLVGRNSPDAVAVLREGGEARGAPFHLVPSETEVTRAERSLEGTTLDVRTPLRAYPALEVGRAGRHQQENALLALRAAELLLSEVQRDPAPARVGLREVRERAGLRGRLEVIQRAPLIVADVAHNPDGLAATLETVRPLVNGQLYVLLGLMSDKDVAGIARLLADAEAVVLPTSLDADRALPAADLADALGAHGVAVGRTGRVAEGLAWFRQQAGTRDTLLATGSHRLVAQLPALQGGTS